MDYNAFDYYDRDFFKSDGTKPARPDGSAAGSDGNKASTGRVLALNTTYVAPLGSSNAPSPSQTYLNSAHLKWDANVIVTITLETTSIPHYISGRDNGSVDLTGYDIATKGGWIQESPPGTYISVTSSDGTTGGAAVALATIAVAGGTAGGAVIHVSGSGSRRMRLKFVVGAAGGTVRMATNGKLGA